MDANENILLIRFKSIGDILFTLPAVYAVRENFPSAKITFLVSREHAPLLEGFREVDEVITLDRARFRSGNPKAILSEAFFLFRRLRGGKFSLVVDFQGYGETAWLAWLSGAPQRWGSVYSTGRKWAYTRGLTRNKKIHPAEWNLFLLRECGLKIGAVKNQFVLPADALAAAKKIFSEHKLDFAKPTLFIQPFTSSPHKNWPLENFLKLARHFHSRGMQIVFGGGPNDRTGLEPARSAGFVITAGTPLLVTAGLMKLSTLIVGADTGFMHLAVAMGKRVVMLMYSNAPGSTHPFQHADWTITPPMGKTVSEIQTGAVIEACAQAAVESTAAADRPGR
ncbi:MAG: glycosyltransferase family 9 protein [Verrucomicrobiota bacterium]|jgi:ADP-heptose:LPS heptosyltransferase